MPYKMNALRLLLLCTLVGLTGCFSLSHESPSERHYVLGGRQQEGAVAPAARLNGLLIGVRQLDLARYLETPLLVVRHEPHEIRYSEFHRWGEDLGGGVNRAVAGYLAARAPFEGVDVVPWPPRTQHDFLIQLQLLRFEGLIPEAPAASDGEAHVLVNWQILAGLNGAVLVRGTTDYRADWSVGDYEDLVTLLDTGLRQLSDELIAGLESVVA